jgi:hypothetical protein
MTRKERAINRYADLAAETSEIISELQVLQELESDVERAPRNAH